MSMDTISWRIRVRPLFSANGQDGYAVDHYSASGAWEGTGYFPTKAAAQKDARRVRRLLRKEAAR